MRDLFCKQTGKIMKADDAVELIESKPKKKFTFFGTEKQKGKRIILKKEGPQSPYLLFNVDANQWQSYRQYKEYEEGRQPTKTTKVPELAEIICNFIEEQEGNPIPCTSVEGHYEGLIDHLQQLGEWNYAELMQEPPGGEGLKMVNMAWKLYRKWNPRPRPRPAPVVAVATIERTQTIPIETEKKRARGNQIFGRNVSSVVRRLADEGYTFAEIRRVVDHFQIELTDRSINGQMWCAKQEGKYGEPAALSDDQLAEVFTLTLTAEPLQKCEKQKELHTHKTKKKKRK